MANVPYTSSRQAARELVHPREYEDEAIYRAYLFGPFRAFRKDRPLGEEAPRRKKALTILKWFLLNPGKPSSADEFIDMFWPDSPPQKALSNFHVTIHCLRRMLEPDLDPRQESAFIRRSLNNFYYFQLRESWWTDTSDVEMLFERGYASDAQGARGTACFYYRRVSSYCIQGFLAEDDSGDWLLPYRRRYQHIYTQVLMRLMQLSMQNNEREELLEYAYQMIRIDPYNELATKVIIDAHLQSGNVARAQRRLQLLWNSLQRDLGVHPTKEFYTLRERIQAASSV